MLKETYFSYVEMSNSGRSCTCSDRWGRRSVELEAHLWPRGELAVPFDVLQGLLELNSKADELIEQLIETISRKTRFDTNKAHKQSRYAK